MYTFPYLILHLSAFAHSCYIRIQQPVMLEDKKALHYSGSFSPYCLAFLRDMVR